MDLKYMDVAFKEAEKAFKRGEVPVGAVIVKDDKILAKTHNIKEKTHCCVNHAEILAIIKASKKINNWRLENCDLYVTLEPCPMCAGAIFQSRIKRVIYGASDPKGGSYGSCFNLNEVKGLNHYPEIQSGIMEEECAQLLKIFFRKKRELKKSEKN
jgi:tRNA(adenine34) deaminase